MPIEPSRPEARIVLNLPVRGSHQESWPTIEVTGLVTVIAHESYGTRSATYEVVAQGLIDIRSGYTRNAIESARIGALNQIERVRRELQTANPDYVTPSRY